MTKAWRAARRLIEKQHTGGKAEYLTIVEATQKGWPHLHVLTTRRWIDQKWLSNLWEKLTGARIVDVRRVKNDRMAASYVAKYLGKAPHRFLQCKRYYFTRGYCPKRADAPAKFDWSSATHVEHASNGHYIVVALLQEGWSTIVASEGYYILEPPAAGT